MAQISFLDSFVFPAKSDVKFSNVKYGEVSFLLKILQLVFICIRNGYKYLSVVKYLLV